MSKRFGRNQRRQARERISALTTMMERQNALLASTNKTLARIQAELDEAKEIAGHMSIVFPATQRIDVGFKSTDGVKVRVPLTDSDSSLDWAISSVGVPATYKVMTMEHLIANINKSDFDMCRHVNVKFADCVWSYAITEHGWRALTVDQRKHFIERELPGVFAQMLSRHTLKA